MWALGDQLGRGFLLGATAGRTTLGGEGLQHQDGSSLLQASAVPNCRAYDPCFGCATHSLPGTMPLIVEVRDAGGELVREIRRD